MILWTDRQVDHNNHLEVVRTRLAKEYRRMVMWQWIAKVVVTTIIFAGAIIMAIFLAHMIHGMSQ